VPGDALDLILVVLASVFAVEGYRQGFVVGVLGVLGFVGGGAVGGVFSPRVAQALAHGPGQRALVAVVVVFLAGVTGQLLASWAGAAVRSRLTWRPVIRVDAVGGATVSVVSVLLIAWVIGSAVSYAPVPAVSRQVDYSVVLRGVGRFMPGSAQAVFSGLRRALASGPYAHDFGALAGAGALTVPSPQPGLVDAPGVAKDRPSIVRIEGTSANCGDFEGSGFVFSAHHVVTNAHVVAGVTERPVVEDGYARYQATVVYFDPRRDVAVLYVPGLQAPPLRFAPAARRGIGAIVAGYPDNKGFTPAPGRIASALAASVPTIYQAGRVIRQVYSIRAHIQPGDSGGPLLAPDGTVFGVVFAAADRKNYGYALTASEIQPDTHTAANRTTPASTQPWHCSLDS
jgi:S1-C subfamily serine protease